MKPQYLNYLSMTLSTAAKEEEILGQLLRGLSPAETAELISELKYEDNDEDDELDGMSCYNYKNFSFLYG